MTVSAVSGSCAASGIDQGSADSRTLPAQWRKSANRVLHWRDWGEDSVVFELRSGHTYQFSALAAAVMGCFEAGHRSEASVVIALAGDLGMQADSALASAVAQCTREFARLNWIEPVSNR